MNFTPSLRYPLASCLAILNALLSPTVTIKVSRRIKPLIVPMVKHWSACVLRAGRRPLFGSFVILVWSHTHIPSKKLTTNQSIALGQLYCFTEEAT